MRNKPDDTTRLHALEQFQSHEHGIPVGRLMGDMDIQRMEAEGQKQLVASQSLPTDIGRHGEPGERDRALLIKWGFELGEPFPDDDKFMPAKMPPGWIKRGSDHDMWSSVVDAKGRERLAIFYKAAFYDRRAFMRIESRYRLDFTSEFPPTLKASGENLAEALGLGPSAHIQIVEFKPTSPHDRPSLCTARDSQTGETLAAFFGSYDDASGLGNAFLCGRFGEHWRNAEHWTE